MEQRDWEGGVAQAVLELTLEPLAQLDFREKTEKGNGGHSPGSALPNSSGKIYLFIWNTAHRDRCKMWESLIHVIYGQPGLVFPGNRDNSCSL